MYYKTTFFTFISLSVSISNQPRQALNVTSCVSTDLINIRFQVSI